MAEQNVIMGKKEMNHDKKMLNELYNELVSVRQSLRESPDETKESFRDRLGSTFLEQSGQIAAGFLGLDIGEDVKDLWYDITHWENSWQHVEKTATDLAGLLPGVAGGYKQIAKIDGVEEYLKKSRNQVLLGHYTDDVTMLGTAADIGLSLTGLDLLGDVRNLVYDFTYWENSQEHIVKTVFDLIGVLPTIGVLKHADEAAALVKAGKKSGKAGEVKAFVKALFEKITERGIPKTQKEAVQKVLESAGKQGLKTLLTQMKMPLTQKQPQSPASKREAGEPITIPAGEDDMQRVFKGLIEPETFARPSAMPSLLNRLRQDLQKVEQENLLTRLKLLYRGFDEESSYFRRSMIDGKNRELHTVRSQISELGQYRPQTDQERLEVEQRIADLNLRMWQTLVDMKELQQSQYGSFNLPAGVKAMTHYEYYGQRNTQRSVAVSSGDMHVTFQFPNLSAGERHQVNNNVVKPVVNALNDLHYRRMMTGALSRQYARGMSNYGG